MRRRLFPLLAGLIFVIAIPVGATAARPLKVPPHGCLVVNVATGAAYSSKGTANPLQTAIDAAAAGVTLEIAGTCAGNFVVNGNLTLRGVAAKKAPLATLDGRDVRPLTVAGVVLMVGPSATVTLQNLRITRGSNEPDGGGINNNGTLTLIDSVVTDNHAFSIPGGQITRGGGIWNGGTLTLTNSTVSANSSVGFGGGIYNAGGNVMLNDSTVAGNTGFGGGIYNSFGTVTLSGATMVQFNTSEGSGGGIVNNGGTIAVSGWAGAVTNNAPDNCEPTLALGAVTCD